MKKSSWIAVVIAGVALAMGFLAGWFVGIARREPTYVRTRPVIRRYLRELNASPEAYWGTKMRQFIAEHPDYVMEGHTNQGAELLYAVFDKVGYWASDVDGDGRQEACDEHGDPLIFFCDDLCRDTIQLGSGAKFLAARPPGFTDAFYINVARFHMWYAHDQEELEDLRRQLEHLEVNGE